MSYRSPLLDRYGGVPVESGPDVGVAEHYGDPLREQRRLEAGEGFVDLSHRGVVSVSGPDRLTWLHSLTSQHLTELAARTSTEALVLSPHGHVEHHLRLVDDGTTTWMTVEPGTAPALVDYLDTMRFWSQVEVTDLTEQVAVVWTPRREPDPVHVTWVAPTEPAGEAGVLLGREVLVPRAQLADYTQAQGPAAGIWAHEALRVAARQPRLGAETDHRTIPHEVGWIGQAVHLDKGCYRGQETVARVHNLGRPPRRLVLLHLDGSDNVLPAHGAPIEAEGRAVGFVGTAVHHHELGPVGLGLIKRSTPLDAPLLAGGVAAAAESVVPA
jgi:tRNA-modifying protein YgfZ